jgi:hypothetical protein
MSFLASFTLRRKRGDRPAHTIRYQSGVEALRLCLAGFIQQVVADVILKRLEGTGLSVVELAHVRAALLKQ